MRKSTWLLLEMHFVKKRITNDGKSWNYSATYHSTPRPRHLVAIKKLIILLHIFEVKVSWPMSHLSRSLVVVSGAMQHKNFSCTISLKLINSWRRRGFLGSSMPASQENALEFKPHHRHLTFVANAIRRGDLCKSGGQQNICLLMKQNVSV